MALDSIQIKIPRIPQRHGRWLLIVLFIWLFLYSGAVIGLDSWYFHVWANNAHLWLMTVLPWKTGDQAARLMDSIPIRGEHHMLSVGAGCLGVVLAITGIIGTIKLSAKKSICFCCNEHYHPTGQKSMAHRIRIAFMTISLLTYVVTSVALIIHIRIFINSPTFDTHYLWSGLSKGSMLYSAIRNEEFDLESWSCGLWHLDSRSQVLSREPNRVAEQCLGGTASRWLLIVYWLMLPVVVFVSWLAFRGFDAWKGDDDVEQDGTDTGLLRQNQESNACGRIRLD